MIRCGGFYFCSSPISTIVLPHNPSDLGRCENLYRLLTFDFTDLLAFVLLFSVVVFLGAGSMGAQLFYFLTGSSLYFSYFILMKRLFLLNAVFLLLMGSMWVPANITQLSHLSPLEVSHDAGVPLVEALNSATSKNPTCIDNYQTWNSSNTYKQTSNWALGFVNTFNMPSSGVMNSLGQDLNGDGLVDYLFHQKISPIGSNTTASNAEYTCVYLNNGHGWDATYRCVSNGSTNPTFYGDCAG